MTKFFVLALLVQLAVTMMAAHWAAARDRLEVVGMTSFWAGATWLVAAVAAPMLMSGPTYGPFFALLFGALSFGIFAGAGELYERRSSADAQYGTPRSSL